MLIQIDPRKLPYKKNDSLLEQQNNRFWLWPDVVLAGEMGHVDSFPWFCSNDSRQLASLPENNTKMFWALQGERDGHDFLVAAYQAGARIFVVRKDKVQSIQNSWQKYGFHYESCLWLITANTNQALLSWASSIRGLLSGFFIGVTGTNGKSSFKEILHQLLTPESFATEKNYNNEIGLPMTMLSLLSSKGENKTRFIFEMGMNHPGEISRLSQIVRPDIGIITYIGAGHLEFLKTIENVARAKAEILHGMPHGSILFINGEMPYQDIVLSEARQKGIRVVRYGLNQDNDFFPQEYRLHDQGSDFVVHDQQLSIGLLGKHQLINAMGAIAVARHLGVSWPNIRVNLLESKTLPGRMTIFSHGNKTMVFDAYNANPDSMRAGIESMEVFRGDRKIVWLLGDMKELGKESAVLHEQIGKFLGSKADAKDYLIAIGDCALNYGHGWGQGRHGQNNDRYFIFPNSQQDKQELVQVLEKIWQTGDILFVKGSRSSCMEEYLPAVFKKAVFDENRSD